MAKKRNKKKSNTIFFIDLVIVIVLVALTAIFLFPTQQTSFAGTDNTNIDTSISSTSISKISENTDMAILRYEWKTTSSGSSSSNTEKDTIVKFTVSDFEDVSNKIVLEDIKNQFDIEPNNIIFTGVKAIDKSGNQISESSIKTKNQKGECDLVFVNEKPIISCSIEATFYVEENSEVIPVNFYGNVNGYADITFVKGEIE